MWPRHVLMAEAGGEGGEGDSAGAGAGSEGGQNTPELSAVVEQVGLLTKSVAMLASGMQEMQSSLKSLPDSIRPPQEDGKGSKGGGPEDGDMFSGVDLEQLDRGQFATLLLSKFVERLDSHLDGKLKPVVERIDNVQNTVVTDLGNRQLSEVKGTNPDVMEWKDEITDILKRNPNLTLRQAYTLARSEDPAKAEKIDSKYEKPKGSGPTDIAFIGMTPTSTNAPAGSGGKMKFAQAAEKAFDDVMASLGGGPFESLPVVGRR